jgi:hypothetical protein
MSRQTRVTAAFLISPLATPLIFMFAAARQGTFSFGDVLAYLVVHGFFAYLAVLLFGFPAYLIFRALRWSSPLLFMLCGGLIGFLVSLLFIPTFDRAHPFIFTLNDRMWFVLAGASSALLFRLLLPNDWVSSSAGNKLP